MMSTRSRFEKEAKGNSEIAYNPIKFSAGCEMSNKQVKRQSTHTEQVTPLGKKISLS